MTYYVYMVLQGNFDTPKMAVVPSRQIVEKMLVAHEKLGNIGGNLPTDPTTIDLNFPDILVHMTDLLRF